MRHLILAIGLAGALQGLPSATLLAADPPGDRKGPPSSVTIEWITSAEAESKTAVEVVGLAPGILDTLAKLGTTALQDVFPVYAEQGGPTLDFGVPPMAGQYRVQDGRLRFTPMFAMEEGVRYRAVFKPGTLPGSGSSNARTLTKVYQLPVTAAVPETVVARIYPSADVLPENLLKFYLHFSGPMSRGHSYDFIQLLQQDGAPVELPFLELAEELWNPAMTRLTLLIDPGRIKTGVQPLEEIGPALEAGKVFQLVILPQWKDASGQPLKAGFTKSFRVVAPDRLPPDPKRWKLTLPAAESRQPLSVQFEKAMDHALAQRLMAVVGEAGTAIDGTIALSDEERQWSFEPAQAWAAGKHRLVVQTTIEDRAGNNIGKPFEVDLFEQVDRELSRNFVELPFMVDARP